jgi:hypothetical protein
MKKYINVSRAVLFVLIGAGTVSAQVDYTPYREILEDHTRGGFMDYQALKETGDDEKLDRFLSSAGSIPLQDLEKPEAAALLINLYNGWTISLIADHYPVSSIRDIGNPWTTPFCLAGGKKYTLDQIQKDILLDRYFDARFHFVLNCAAVSCPPLLPRPVTGPSLEADLEKAAANFINDPEFNRFTIEKRRKGLRRVNTAAAEISEIFKWYREDFKKQYGSLNAALAGYVKDPAVSSLLDEDRTETEYITYDWSLNDTKNR